MSTTQPQADSYDSPWKEAIEINQSRALRFLPTGTVIGDQILLDLTLPAANLCWNFQSWVSVGAYCNTPLQFG